MQMHLMSKWLLSFLCGIFIGLSTFTSAQETPKSRYRMQEVVVTASRLPSTFMETVRHVTVLDSTDIRSLPVQSVQELLSYVQSADVKQRGPLGVQADVSLRGSTFEQTLVLLNGVKVTDPQTGHHQLNIPVSLQDIERIEVLHGHGSSIYGPNAFGGVVNILTRESRGAFLSTGAVAGEYGLLEGHITSAYPVGRTANRLSFSKRISGGYRPNTDFDITRFTHTTTVDVGEQQMNLLAGYMRKAFGANDFYAGNFPNQREETRTSIVQMGGEFQVRKMTLLPKMYWRRNYDEFILDSQRADWYRNRHTTDSYGGELQSQFTSALGQTAVGGELGRELIRSNSLGNHQRSRGGLFLEHQMELASSLDVMTGAFAYYHSGWGWKVWPGVGIGLSVTPTLQVYGNIGKAYRVPNFTELYYDSPANKGNPSLKPEESLSYEGGLKWLDRGLLGNISLFRRHGNNLIDWGRNHSDDPWMVRNLSRIRTTGMEAAVDVFPHQSGFSGPVNRIELKYGYLRSTIQEVAATQSKYVFNYPRHQVMVDIILSLPFRLRQRWSYRYENRLSGSGHQTHQIVDTRLYRRSANFRLFLDVTNLFNEQYRYFPGVPMPGRWIRLGIETTINGTD